MLGRSRKRSSIGAARDPDFVWWKHGVIYQVYPRSFQDTNGDGIGDLDGVIQRLDYLVGLGVDAIWLCPIFKSPMADFGYDISDYVAIDPMFGDLATFDRLVAQAHKRRLKVILDFIPNHTADQHRWFVESRTSRANPKRDWYIWRDRAPDGGPPNNWRSEFGGPAWTLDEATGQYFYHAFLPSRPDLNWRNPEVISAMLEVMRFWFERGVDGFRVDAIHHLFEREDLADNPPNPAWHEGMSPAEGLLRASTIDQPEVHEAIAAMREVAEQFEDRVLIGEAYLPVERLMAYYGGAGDGFHLPFNFHLMSIPWTSAAIAGLVSEYEAKLPANGWPNWVLGNHDRSRLASRLGPDQARVAALLLLTLRGTPTLYQGDELGMTDVPIPPDRVQDPWEINVPGLGFGRDPVRTPMLWSARPYAGFSTTEPWLPISSRATELCVEHQSDDPASILSLYRALLALRRREPVFSQGSYAPFDITDSIFAFERRLGETRIVVVLDLAGQGGELKVAPGEILLSTCKRSQNRTDGRLIVGANEGVIVRID